MALESLGGRLTVLIIASIAAWMLGAASSMLADSPLPTVFPDGSYVTLVVISVFSFSFLFFGYPAPLVLFLGGIFAGNHLKLAGGDVYTVLLSVVCIMAAYSSIRLGDALLDDMVGKGNFKRAAKISLILIAVALAVSLALDLSGW